MASKQGTLLTVAQDQEGAAPEIVTPLRRLPVDSIGYDIARGLVPGAASFGAYGERVTSGAEDNRLIWPDGIFSLPDAAGVQMSIVSTSANDDLAGTHAQVLELHYLDADLVEKEEFVNMDGLTPVLTTATDIRFINCLHVHQVGGQATNFAEGDITASNGGVVYAQIAAGEVRCTSSARMVPAGKECYVAGAVAGATSGTAAASVVIQLAASELDGNQYVDPLIFFPYGSIGVQDTSTPYNFFVPPVFKAGTVVAMIGTTDKGATITGSWFGWIEDV